MTTGTSWSDVALVLGMSLMSFGILALILGLIYATWRARLSVTREEAYSKLAQEVASAQRGTAEALQQALGELAEIRQRTAAMERLLKEVG